MIRQTLEFHHGSANPDYEINQRMKMRVYYCGKCGDSWSAPDESEGLWWKALASSHIKGELPQICAFQWMNAHTNFDGLQTKEIAGHVSSEGDRCCHCGLTLKGKGAFECKRCKGLNFNFSRGG